MSLRSIVMYVRDISRATRFFHEGLQLSVAHATHTTTHLSFTNNPTSLVLQAVDGYEDLISTLVH
jgi:catechol 2,3-dioxygenase-like lactoylglutathione lyase family enzyme